MRFLHDRPRAVVSLLLGGILLTLLLQLGSRGLGEPDEGRYGEMGREMLVTGDWMVPRINGIPHYAKPPWIYWCIGTSLRLAGVNEWGARLPSALAATATVLVVFALGRQMGGLRAGLFSAAALSTMFLFFVAGRLITPDMMLTSFITLALWCFWNWWRVGVGVTAPPKAGRPWLQGFYIALGLAFLDKGPVGLAVAGLTVLGFLTATRGLSNVPKTCWGRGLATVALIALPWFLLMVWLNPDLLDFFLRGEIRDRVVSGRGRTKVWYYFFLVLPIACWPWTFLALPAARRHWDRWRAGGGEGAASAFLLSWVLLPFALFTVSGSKLPTYILPLMPPISLMVGIWLSGERPDGSPTRPPRWAALATWVFLPVLALVPWFIVHRAFHQPSLAWLAPAAMAGLLVVGLAYAASRLPAAWRAIGTSVAWWIGAAILLQGLVLLAGWTETLLGHNSSWRSLTDAVPAGQAVGVPISPDLHPRPGPVAFAPREGPRVAMYEFFFNSGSFHLMGRRAEVVPRYGGDTLWEIARDRNVAPRPGREELLALLRAPARVYLFTRLEYVEGLERESGVPLTVVATAGTKKHGGVVVRTR